ncbi:MAG: TraB/GumN family protein [Bacteroidaceae bacterium]|nr:TraB/GumN family protein [Bacteroidaceae bacterium]
MKRFLLIIVASLSATILVNAQLLYRISGNSLEKPSYVVGTYHLAPASFVDSIPGAREAFASVEQVCGELDMRDLQAPGNVEKMTDAMRMPDGKSLKELLSEDEMARLNAYMRSVMGVDFTNPMIDMQMGKFTPAAVMTQLQIVQYMKVTPGFNPAALIDVYFQNEAAKAGKPVIGFENVDFQVSVLYKGSSLERQKELLFCMVGNPEKTLQTVKDIANAYFAQELAKLEQLANEDMDGDCGSTPEEKDALIYNRNADWAEKIPAIIGEKPTLFVVGALHLPGERGLLQLLKDKGYTVESVKE